MTERRVQVPPAAISHLSRVDSAMAALIRRIGPIDYRVDTDLWRSVVGAIVGQQLSVKAASTIRARVAALGTSGFPDPGMLLEVPDEVLRGCGLSRAKTAYVRGAARAWIDGSIATDALMAAPDEQVIESLTSLRGVGRWTAEMVLIFCLERPDVLAVDDLGIRSAVGGLYGHPARPNRMVVGTIGERWAPYRSFASLYLWRSLA